QSWRSGRCPSDDLDAGLKGIHGGDVPCNRAVGVELVHLPSGLPGGRDWEVRPIRYDSPRLDGRLARDGASVTVPDMVRHLNTVDGSRSAHEIPHGVQIP